MRLLVWAQTDAPDIPEELQRIPFEAWIRFGAIFVGSVLLAVLVNSALRRLLLRAGADKVSARIVGRIVGYIIGVAGLVYALGSLNVRIGPLLGALGIGGIALAFAMQDTIENLISGVFLETRRMFKRGDQIESGSFQGIVEDVNLRNVIIRTFGGRRVFLPNSEVIKNPIVNVTALGRRRTTLKVGVRYDTDLGHAQEVLMSAVRSVNDVFEYPEPDAWVEEFSDSAITFAVRFWHEPEQPTMWRVRDTVAQRVKKALDEAGITIPFPQRTVWWGQEAEDAATEDGQSKHSEPAPDPLSTFRDDDA